MLLLRKWVHIPAWCRKRYCLPESKHKAAGNSPPTRGELSRSDSYSINIKAFFSCVLLERKHTHPKRKKKHPKPLTHLATQWGKGQTTFDKYVKTPPKPWENMYKSFRLTAFTAHGRESQNCTLALLAWKDIYLSSYKTARMIFIYFAHFLTQIQGFYGKLQSVWLMKSKDVLTAPKISNCADSNRGLQCWHCSWRQEKRKKEKENVEKNRQNLGNFCFKNLKFQWRCPNPFIPVHTCEPGGHQSISHTSQQNQLPLEPINLLCKRLNGVVYRGSRSQKRSQRAVRELGSPLHPLGRTRKKLIYMSTPSTHSLELWNVPRSRKGL